MSNDILTSLLSDYEQKKRKAEVNFEHQKVELYKKIPRLQEIEDELNSVAINETKNILFGNSSSLENLHQKIESLKEERKKILSKNNLSINDLQPKYECCLCKDTGYIKSGTSATVMCSCLKQKLLNISYNKSNMTNLSKENFEKDMPNWAMPPTVLQCVDSIIPGRMYVYVLNCKSENKDIAIDFLSYLVGHRSLEDEGLLDPESAKPVLRQYIQEEIEENEGMGNEEELISSPESWAITENRLLTYKYNILPHMDLQLHPMLSVSSKREGGVYADILKEILNYIDGNEAIEKCLDRIQTLCNSFI